MAVRRWPISCPRSPHFGLSASSGRSTVWTRQPILGYVRKLEFPGGGFRGGLWDEQTDVEYTFYGLGCLGVLAGE